MTPRGLSLLLPLAALLAVYAAALAGPFVLDDPVNLAPAWQWINGERSAWSALFDNHSGPLGRPLAYLTLMANALATGAAPWSYKLFNLVLHAVAAALAWLLVRTLLRSTHPAHPAWVPAAIVAAWALHPMLVSTVMYTVQRMTMLAAIAQLCAVLVYVRARVDAGPGAGAPLQRLFVPFAVIVAIGALCKETAVLAPLLCLAVEATVYARRDRPAWVGRFFLLFLAFPALAALAWLAIDRDGWLGAYLGREFTLAERLMTQPRVLWNQAGAWLWPAPQALALYRDGFATSTSLWAPAATLPALAGGIATLFAAFAARRRWPLFALGVFWFVASHALEASVFALEPYFEHRNYLASLGLALSVSALAAAAFARWPARRAQALAIAVVAVLGLLTATRAWHWRHLDGVLAHEGPPAPELSRRLQVDRAIRAFERGDRDARDAALAPLAQGSRGDRASSALWQAVFACDDAGRLDPARRETLAASGPRVITHNHVSALWLLARRAEAERCPGLDRAAFAAVLDRWEAASRTPVSPYAVREFRRMRIRLADGNPR